MLKFSKTKKLYLCISGSKFSVHLGGSVLLNISKTIRRLKNSHVCLDNITVSIIHKGASVRSEQNIPGEIRIRSITLYALQRRLNKPF